MIWFVIGLILSAMIVLFIKVPLAPKDSLKAYKDFMDLEHKPKE